MNILNTNQMLYDFDTKYGKCSVRNCWNKICAASPQAECADYKCQCSDGYITHPPNSIANCCYEQKSQMIAFFLEIFIGFGLGHIYSLNYNLGMTKLIIYSVNCLLFFLTLIYRLVKDEKIGYEKSILLRFSNIVSMLICFCVYTIWQCIDILLIGTNYYADGNGAPLKMW